MSLKNFNLDWKCILMFVFLLFLIIQPQALGAEEKRIWLKESDTKYNMDGSAFSEFTLMNNQEPLIIDVHDIVAAQCFLKDRRNDRSLLFSIKPILMDGGIKFKVSSLFNSYGSVIIKLKLGEEIYVAQRQFRLYGNSYHNQLKIEKNLSMDKLIKPNFVLESNRNLQRGRPIVLKYNTQQDTDKDVPSLRASVYNQQGYKEEVPVINQKQELCFTIPREPILSIYPSYKADVYSLFVSEHKGGKAVHASFTTNVYSTKREYLNIKHGVYWFIFVSVLTACLFVYLLGRNKHVY